MAGSNMYHRVLVGLPRNWRVITVASLTTLGLVYESGHSARGDGWWLSKAKPEVTKPAAVQGTSTGNGFSATIQRLMTDARLYADKGELDKAVQLAERAAKISEASSSLLGPASDYSPERTARFASELRARRDSVAQRTIPAAAAPAVVAAVTRSNAAAPESPTIVSPPARPLERRVVERALAERTVTDRPAELAAEALVSEPPWAEELPPTPAPESEPRDKPVKYRRSIFARASQPTNEEVDESQSVATESASPPIVDSAIVDSAIDDVLDAKFAGGSPVESEPMMRSVAFTHANPPHLDPETARAEDGPFSPVGGVQTVAAETSASDVTPSPKAPARPPSWEDEAFAEELLLGNTSSSTTAGTSTKATAPSTKNNAPRFPDEAFPVQNVVQLRRRLETAASLNPGGAYTVPASPATGPARAAGPMSFSDSDFEGPAPEAGESTLFETDEETIDWNNLPDFSDRPQPQTPVQTGVSPSERPVVRLREHRVLPDHVRAALLKAAAWPPAPTARRHIVGFSEPMLWQSVEEHDSVPPALSLVKRIGGGTIDSRPANGASSPPDLRDLSTSAMPGDSTKHAGQRLIPAVTVEQTGFRSIELSPDSIPMTGSSGPTLSFPDRASDADSILTDSATAPRSELPRSARSQVESVRATVRPKAVTPKSPTSNSKAGQNVSNHSFSIIEPVATALQLPLATTASLLAGAGLTLLGLGLLLVRAAIRWRHS